MNDGNVGLAFTCSWGWILDFLFALRLANKLANLWSEYTVSCPLVVDVCAAVVCFSSSPESASADCGSAGSGVLALLLAAVGGAEVAAGVRLVDDAELVDLALVGELWLTD